MKNILKVCLILTLCASLLMVVGCKKKADENVTTPSGTQPATTAPQGGNQGGANPGGNGDAQPTEPKAPENPEGDPFDGTEPTGPVVGVEIPDPSEGGSGVEPTDDIEVDFDDLIG